MEEAHTGSNKTFTLQYINASNQHLVHLKLMQNYMSIISQWKFKKYVYIIYDMHKYWNTLTIYTRERMVESSHT